MLRLSLLSFPWAASPPPPHARTQQRRWQQASQGVGSRLSVGEWTMVHADVGGAIVAISDWPRAFVSASVTLSPLFTLLPRLAHMMTRSRQRTTSCSVRVGAREEWRQSPTTHPQSARAARRVTHPTRAQHVLAHVHPLNKDVRGAVCTVLYCMCLCCSVHGGT